jgi:RNA polymerase sigma factor for flagellar operon FliA
MGMSREELSQHVAGHWASYKEDGDDASRTFLIEHYYVHLVKPVANRMGMQLSSAVDRNDLASYGTFGLIDAIEKFDQSKGVKFETYAVSRIRGSILDELRSIDWVPRGIRSKVRDMDRTSGQLESELGRTPGSGELAARMGVTTKALRQINVTGVTALETFGANGDDLSIGDVAPDHSIDPEQSAIVSDITERVATAVQTLSERSRAIIALYYVEHMTLGEIGDILGVTESRICQLHGDVLRNLRSALEAA